MELIGGAVITEAKPAVTVNTARSSSRSVNEHPDGAISCPNLPKLPPAFKAVVFVPKPTLTNISYFNIYSTTTQQTCFNTAAATDALLLPILNYST